LRRETHEKNDSATRHIADKIRIKPLDKGFGNPACGRVGSTGLVPASVRHYISKLNFVPFSTGK
jgi:hypothetical protein